jgi:hypothetical protein
MRGAHGDATVGFGREDVDEGVGMTVKGNGGGGFEELAVDSGEDADDVIGARRRTDDAGMLVDGFEELADDEGNRLDALDLFLSSNQLALEVLLFVLDVFLLRDR